jgi:hypothetical protein
MPIPREPRPEPADRDRNIRHFGGITEKCTTESTDSPKRNLRDVLCLAEIVSRFDVVALQEVSESSGACGS